MAARKARKAAARVLSALTDDPDTVCNAELVVGELLSNAARHADGNVCLELSAVDGYAHLSVHDTSPTFAMEIRKPVDEMSESGRGLYIISKLAERIDVTPLTNIGKCVSVRLNLRVRETDPFVPCSRHWLRGGGRVCMAPLIARYQPAIAAP